MDVLEVVNKIYRNRVRVAVISLGLLILLFGLISAQPEPHNGDILPPVETHAN
jgi:hypothetical protein